MYVRCTSAAKATNDSGTSIQGRNAAASCKPIYTGIHLRRTICVSKEAMERLQLSNAEGSLMACPQPYRSLMMPAQHFKPGDFTFRHRFGRISGNKSWWEQEARSNEPIIDHTKQSWYFSNASSALTSDAEPNRSRFNIHQRLKIQKMYLRYNLLYQNYIMVIMSKYLCLNGHILIKSGGVVYY
ncbi:Hypothetical_protein [Hexamita inflata]|uniref:Hypothetical_protein n=1 Tax=Hexamita inflata TaxID=28002 RepID=A0AA86P7G7_9EUKA|nr:Hypothetical protein HINF_LOCUS19988 [Hexamita inflata]